MCRSSIRQAEYYAQRASAGLIITEATAISPEGFGWADTPGLWTDEQVRGWRHVTDAVHAAGGRIIAQLWHTGAISHPELLEGLRRMLLLLRWTGRPCTALGNAVIQTTHLSTITINPELNMPKTTPKENRAIVLEAFDTLFNKRDYAAAERF
jgi:2,4-dienoyl-CoA reductase-like NADH-dependent reductase (Old Yellow Enzyme family)